MADIQEMRKYLDSIRQGIEDINSIALEAEEASEGLVKKVSDLAGIGTKGGIVRSIVTRGLVAFPMGYRIAQQASSALLVFRYLDKSRQQRMEEEKEFNNLMSKREKIVRRLHRMEKDQTKIRAGTLSVLEKETYFNDLSVKMKLKSMSIQDAILESSSRLAETTKGLRRSGRKAMGREARRRLRGGGTGLSQFLFGGTGGSFLQMSEMELQTLGERKRDLGGELATTERELKAARIAYTREASGTAAKKEAEIKMNTIRETRDILKGVIEDLTEEIAVKASEMASNVVDITESSGLRVGVSGVIPGISANIDASSMSQEDLVDMLIKKAGLGEPLIENLEQLTFFAGIIHKMEKFRDKVAKKLSLFLGFFTLKKLNMLGSFLLKGLMVFSGIILVMSILVALIYGAYKLGLFDYMYKVGEFFTDVGGSFIDSLMTFLTGLWDFLTGTWDFLSGFIGFFMGLFSGDGDLMSKSVEKMITGIGKIGIGLVQILGGAIGMLITGAVGIVVGAIFTGLAGVAGALGAIFGKNPGGAISGAGIGGVVGGLIGLGVTGGNPLGMKFGAAIGGIAGGMIGGRMETGGVTPIGGGNFLVGERGPELVSLPGNTRVFNNSDTRNMMSPTININVTGRVGASDTELNDIARKIGQKINIEMNRYNSSGLRG